MKKQWNSLRHPKCSKKTLDESIKDGDCQASKSIAQACKLEWLGTCRYNNPMKIKREN